MKLYTYWRSLATFRVRIALNLKGLEYESIYVDLDAGQQNKTDYKSVNPQMVIPSRRAEMKSPLGTRTPEVVPFHTNTRSALGST